MMRWHSNALRFPMWVICWVAILIVGAFYIVSELLSPASVVAKNDYKEGSVSSEKNISQEKIGVRKELFRGLCRAQMTCSKALLQIDYGKKASGTISERMEDVCCLIQQELSFDKKGEPYQSIAIWKAVTALLNYNTMSCSVAQLEFLHGRAYGHQIPPVFDPNSLTDITKLCAQQADLLLLGENL